MSSSIIIPGDVINYDAERSVVIGPGTNLNPITNQIIPIHSGVLHQTDKSIYVESNPKRYIPATNDFVIGVVTGTFGDSFRVQLSNFSFPASLSALAFPNASKRNRPNIKVGNLVYARVSSAIPEIDIEIECVDATTGKDGGFGLLEDGYVFDVKLGFARDLLFNANHLLMDLLAKKCEFEIAIGVNGKIWINTNNLKYTLAASRSIERCQYVKHSEYNKVINTTFSELNL